LGTWLGQARRMTRMMKRQLEDELNLEKELKIRPRATPLPSTPKQQSSMQRDDTHSPAHEAGAHESGASPDDRGAGEPAARSETPGGDDEQNAAEPPAQENAS
jgi:Sec-independent protein translocase protein TatA